jgi:hypothetical protein
VLVSNDATTEKAGIDYKGIFHDLRHASKKDMTKKMKKFDVRDAGIEILSMADKVLRPGTCGHSAETAFDPEQTAKRLGSNFEPSDLNDYVLCFLVCQTLRSRSTLFWLR